MKNKTYHKIFWATSMLFNLFSAVLCGLLTILFAVENLNILAHMFAILFVWCGVLSFYSCEKWVLVDTKLDKYNN